MKPDECVRQKLGGFVDGELSGAERRQVSEHLATCAECAVEAESLSRLGDLLRGSLPEGPAPSALEGLAGGVISRVRAERAESWHGFVERLLDDWHYAIVGTGAVAAAFVAVAFVSLMLEFGPAPERDDSLAALISNLNSPAGTLFVEATPATGKDRSSMLMQVNNELVMPDDSLPGAVVPLVLRATTEQEFVGALSDAMTHDGRLLELGSMTAQQRRYTEGLLDAIGQLRAGQAAFSSPGSLSIHSLWLVTNTGVTAKGI